MQNAKYLWYFLLAVYSVVLIILELQTSQEHIRNYFTDIQGPVRFYAVNTTLSVMLLWATALIFLIARHCDGQARRRERSWFYLSQAVLFFCLGIDDRFQFHEWAAFRLDIPDHYVLILVGLAEVGCLLYWRRVLFSNRTAVSNLVLGGALFLVMLGIDALAPEKQILRLSLEDLCKAWSAMFFCFYGWAFLQREIEQLRKEGGQA